MSVPKKEFKGSEYWYSLSMNDKYNLHVIMTDTWERRLWMDNPECEMDGAFMLHLLNLGYRFQDDILQVI